LLDFILKEEILEKRDNNSFRWVHDKLQEAALSLTGKRRESFQLDIGRTLYYGLDKKQVEDELFTIVDLINNGNVLRLTEFASANLRAAEKARDLSAFQSAAEYAAHGIGLLKDDKWSSDRPLTLKLYTMAAEMEAMVGNFAASELYSSEVLSQPDLSIMETIPLKMAKASTTGSTDLKFDESVKFYLQLLDEIGCRVTWTRTRKLVPVQSIVKLMRIIKRVKATPQSFYDKMVPMDDPRQKAIASVYSKLVYYSYMAGDILLFVLATCKLVEMTLDYGVNEFSAKSFSSLGSAIIMSMEDFETATTFNLIALSMLQKFRGMHSSETVSIVEADE
jgi:predicted ATPase